MTTESESIQGCGVSTHPNLAESLFQKVGDFLSFIFFESAVFSQLITACLGQSSCGPVEMVRLDLCIRCNKLCPVYHAAHVQICCRKQFECQSARYDLRLLRFLSSPMYAWDLQVRYKRHMTPQ